MTLPETNKSTIPHWLLYIGIAAAVYMVVLWEAHVGDFAYQILLGVAIPIAVAVVFGAWVAVKGRLSSRYKELCDMLFQELDRSNGAFYMDKLRVAPSSEAQEVSFWLVSRSKDRTIRRLRIACGHELSFWGNLWVGIKNRFRVLRFSWPSPHAWSGLYAPILEMSPDQPSVIGVKGNGLWVTDGSQTDTPAMHRVCMNGICTLELRKPLQLPVGNPRSHNIKVTVFVQADKEWEGDIQVSSDVDGFTQSKARHMVVSRKFRHIKHEV